MLLQCRLFRRGVGNYKQPILLKYVFSLGALTLGVCKRRDFANIVFLVDAIAIAVFANAVSANTTFCVCERLCVCERCECKHQMY